MKIVVVSDTHGNRKNLETALDFAYSLEIETALHCGDIGDPICLEPFSRFNGFFALGNVDRDYADLSARIRRMYASNSEDAPKGRLAPFHEIRLADTPVALCHGHTETLSRLIDSGANRIVFHGHTHRRKNELVAVGGRAASHDGRSSPDKTNDDDGATVRIINPGALGGVRHQSRSFCIVDGETRHCEFYEIPAAMRGCVPRRIADPL